ncbi:MAG TPA: transcription antitermination factor NusB [Clostridia bacterium]|nr:transcription antitermination factor NusB [Clostridia bacterium]
MTTTHGVQNRRRSREIALQVLYSLAQGNASYEQTFDLYAHEAPLVLAYALKLIQGVQAHQDAILDEVGAHSANWGIDRVAVVDRVILSIAVFEMKYGKPPIKTAIAANEAVELAKEFGGAESGSFVNGVLRGIGGAGD